MLEATPTIAGLAVEDLMAMSDDQVLTAVTGLQNTNLTAAEKELLLYLCKWGMLAPDGLKV